MELLVAADDRTGALETAGVLADRLGQPVPVSVWPATSTRPVSVVDLGSRHLSRAQARVRVGGLPSARRLAHKIDSTLRGNWAAEIASLADTRPVVLIPALPVFGRTCVGGVVLEHGRPVHEGDAGDDVRGRVTNSRPADALRRSDVRTVEELASGHDLDAWLGAPAGVAVADASDQATIDRLVESWRNGPVEVVLAGTSAVIGAAPGSAERRSPWPVVEGPVLVVCGSAHPVARAQIAAAEQRGVLISVSAGDAVVGALERGGTVVLVTDAPDGLPDAAVAARVVTALASSVAAIRRRVHLGALVIIGGDTAAAVLGDSVVMVQGSAAPGTAWSRVEGMAGPVITRSGGFGNDRALIDLLQVIMPS